MQECCQKVNKQNKVKALDLELTIARQAILLEGRKSIDTRFSAKQYSDFPPLGKDYSGGVLIQQMLIS